MSKFEQINEIQKQYRRGLRSYDSAIKGIKDIFPYANNDYVEWLLFEYQYN